MRAVFIIALLGLAPLAASGQELRLKRDLPKIAWQGCPRTTAPEPVTPAQRQEAERLATQANEAAILGDNTAALDLLTRAATRDPSSERVAYRRARTLEALERKDEAVAEYCRSMALAPSAADVPEVRQRIAALTDPGGFAVPAAAATAFAVALGHYDAGRLADAEVALGSVIELVPAWGDALYDRGAVRLALGRKDDAAADLRRYLELNPGAPEFNDVLRVLGPEPTSAGPRYSASSAFATGLLLPGLGHFTTGRPGRGLMFLGTAAAAVTTGYLVRRVEVDCLSPPVNGRCPSDQIVNEQVERPYLVPAVAAAVAVGLLGAVDAFAGARRLAAADSARADGGRTGASLELPSVEVGSRGARLNLVRFSF